MTSTQRNLGIPLDLDAVHGVRVNRFAADHRAATLTIVCFAVLLVSFLGVRFLPGRHGGEFG